MRYSLKKSVSNYSTYYKIHKSIALFNLNPEDSSSMRGLHENNWRKATFWVLIGVFKSQSVEDCKYEMRKKHKSQQKHLLKLHSRNVENWSNWSFKKERIKMNKLGIRKFKVFKIESFLVCKEKKVLYVNQLQIWTGKRKKN